MSKQNETNSSDMNCNRINFIGTGAPTTTTYRNQNVSSVLDLYTHLRIH